MIVSCNPEGKPNVMTAGWTMVVSDDPPMVAAFIGKSRFTHGRIESTGQFVYTYPGADMEHEMLYAGTHSGRNVDKFDVLDLATSPADKVKPPLLTKALACFECRVEEKIDRGSHTMFVGRVVGAHANDKDVPRLYNLGAGRNGKRVFEGLPHPEKND
jgi:flavin reductase (DIM6/NTAB) family NADH-FMN oxidoreductase RutF